MALAPVFVRFPSSFNLSFRQGSHSKYGHRALRRRRRTLRHVTWLRSWSLTGAWAYARKLLFYAFLGFRLMSATIWCWFVSVQDNKSRPHKNHKNSARLVRWLAGWLVTTYVEHPAQAVFNEGEGSHATPPQRRQLRESPARRILVFLVMKIRWASLIILISQGSERYLTGLFASVQTPDAVILLWFAGQGGSEVQLFVKELVIPKLKIHESVENTLDLRWFE